MVGGIVVVNMVDVGSIVGNGVIVAVDMVIVNGFVVGGVVVDMVVGVVVVVVGVVVGIGTQVKLPSVLTHLVFCVLQLSV